MKTLRAIAIATSTLLLAGCTSPWAAEISEYEKEIAAIKEDSFPNVDLTFTEGYGKEDYNLADEEELFALMDASCTYATENGVVEEGPRFAGEAYKDVIFPQEYVRIAAADYDAHWEHRETYGFTYSGGLYTLQSDASEETIKLDKRFGTPLEIDSCYFPVGFTTQTIMHERSASGAEERWGVVKIADDIYQASFFDNVIREYRFNAEGLLYSALWIDLNNSESPIIEAYKYTYGMPPAEEQQRFEALLTERQ